MNGRSGRAGVSSPNTFMMIWHQAVYLIYYYGELDRWYFPWLALRSKDALQSFSMKGSGARRIDESHSEESRFR